MRCVPGPGSHCSSRPAPPPALRRSVQRRRDELQGTGLTVLAALGSADPVGGARMLADHLDGMILHRLTSEDADSDPREDLRRLVRALR